MKAKPRRPAPPARAPSLSDQLRVLIRARGASLADLAQRARVHPGVLVRFVNEGGSMTLGSADRVAAALGGLKLVEGRPMRGAKELRGEPRRRVPFGRALAEDGRTLIVNETEQGAIDRVIAWHEEGLSLREIARRLDEMHIRPRLGGARWKPSSDARLLGRASRASP
jgi:hypothetical protein